MTAREPSHIDYPHSLLLTDLYQLKMAEAYLAEGLTDCAVFEFFVRKLPKHRGFLVAAGLEQAIDYIRGATCSADELAWLKDSGHCSGAMTEYLANFRFSGDVDAMPEGTIFFPDEPVIRVTAPIAEAQLLETRIINFLQYQTLVATKATRMVLAAGDRTLIDFGLRRAHSGEAGLLAARASYVAGFAGSATVLAEKRFGVPIFGTMAHSYIQAHNRESEAFLGFARAHPESTVFLLDTYDTEAAAEMLVRLAPKLASERIPIKGIRLDSGDLAEHARRVRAILDRAGLKNAKIVASGGIDETLLEALDKAGAPIDLYGVGTSLVTSEDAPALDCAYKLKAYAGKPRRKRSEGKSFWPGPTQVFRRLDQQGRLLGDVIARAQSKLPGEPLLQPIIRNGALIRPLPDIKAVRRYAAEQRDRLPEALRDLENPPAYPVEVDEGLRSLAAEVDALATD